MCSLISFIFTCGVHKKEGIINFGFAANAEDAIQNFGRQAFDHPNGTAALFIQLSG
jgi:hypothetical protein